MHSSVAGIQDLLDHRYFYAEANSCGRYTCGLARQAIIEFLREHAEESVFLDPGWYQCILDFKDNRSVIGFTVEQMIISRLASSGLASDDLVLNRAAITSFTSNITTLSTAEGSYYYVPLQFNFKAIDVLYVEISERRAKVTGIQITINKDHQITQDMFFNRWDDWIEPLKEFEIEASFLWIVEDERGQEEVEKKVRSRNLLKWPNYTVHWAYVEQIDRQLAETLVSIRPSQDPSGIDDGNKIGGRREWWCGR